ncbi:MULTISPECIES: hypothetical protein [Anaeromyxobacter]|uniref:hypothetical protein n=1 Tax=Anaeromyxobacter TaxID=161492 RepID=UPI001F5A17B2|nr:MULTISPECIES: hypothetical protein [unclassified Anaeromyxobacter]
MSKMPISGDPFVENEKAFEAALVATIRLRLKQTGVDASVLPKFGLDIAVFMRHATGTRVRFLEAKCFSAAAGRIGIGNDAGGGTQVEMLLRPSEELAVISGAVRWVLLDTTRPRGSARYAMFDCAELRSAASGGAVARGKQNNLRIMAFADRYVTWDEMIDRVVEFLVT